MSYYRERSLIVRLRYKLVEKFRVRRCPVCERLFHPSWCWTTCGRCLPGPLSKALDDPFDYAIGLRSGRVIRFNECSLDGGWLLIDNVMENNVPVLTTTHEGKPWPFCFDRGIAVRLADIEWCADAPHGS